MGTFHVGVTIENLTDRRKWARVSQCARRSRRSPAPRVLSSMCRLLRHSFNESDLRAARRKERQRLRASIADALSADSPG